MTNYGALPDLHQKPRGQVLAAELYYYSSEVLEKTAATMIQLKNEMGHQSVKLPPGMPKIVFQQDGASAHRARKDQEWCRADFPGLLEAAIRDCL